MKTVLKFIYILTILNTGWSDDNTLVPKTTPKYTNFFTATAYKIDGTPYNEIYYINDENEIFKYSEEYNESSLSSTQKVWQWDGSKIAKEACKEKVFNGFLRSSQCQNNIKLFSIRNLVPVKIDFKKYRKTTSLYLCSENYLDFTCANFVQNEIFEETKNDRIKVLESSGFEQVSNFKATGYLPNLSIDISNSFDNNLLILYSQKENKEQINSARIIKIGPRGSNQKVLSRLSRRNKKSTNTNSEKTIQDLSISLNLDLPNNKNIKFFGTFITDNKFFFLYNELNLEEDYTARIGQICLSDNQTTTNTLLPLTFLKSRLTCNLSNKPIKLISVDNISKTVLALFANEKSFFICSFGMEEIADKLFSYDGITRLLGSVQQFSHQQKELLGNCDFSKINRLFETVPQAKYTSKSSGINQIHVQSIAPEKMSRRSSSSSFSDYDKNSRTFILEKHILSTNNLIEGKTEGKLVFSADHEDFENTVTAFSGLILNDSYLLTLGLSSGKILKYTIPPNGMNLTMGESVQKYQTFERTANDVRSISKISSLNANIVCESEDGVSVHVDDNFNVPEKEPSMNFDEIISTYSKEDTHQVSQGHTGMSSNVDRNENNKLDQSNPDLLDTVINNIIFYLKLLTSEGQENVDTSHGTIDLTATLICLFCLFIFISCCFISCFCCLKFRFDYKRLKKDTNRLYRDAVEGHKLLQQTMDGKEDGTRERLGDTLDKMRKFDRKEEKFSRQKNISRDRQSGIRSSPTSQKSYFAQDSVKSSLREL